MGELEWMDLWDCGPIPPAGAMIYYVPDDGSYVGRGYFLDGHFYSLRHHKIRNARWWAFPTKTAVQGYPHIHSGPTAQQYHRAWGIIQEIIVNVM